MNKFKLSLAAVLLAIMATFTLQNTTTYAANAADFDPGYIIDDYVFYNSNAMNVDQIQNFLNAKVGTCDYYGTQPASDWGYPNITHAQLAQYKREGSNGFSQDTGFHAPPYKCLSMYKQSTPYMEAASSYCNAIGAGERTAAQIINDVAKACGINPQVLIVLLQKEQGLITDNWPLNRQLRNATGFACPDTAPCDPQYDGFFYQVYYAARQFKVYQAFPDSYNYRAGRSNNIYWHPDMARCGSSSVYIQNQATAALYIYTPYRPNQAALNNLYGTGDSCSSYGNRNFWRMFTDWFGTTRGRDLIVNNVVIDQSLQITPSVSDTANTPYTATFRIKNNSNTTINLGYMFVSVRDVDNNNLDFPAQNIVIQPNSTYTYTATRTFPLVGKLKAYIGGNINLIGWSYTIPRLQDNTLVRETTITSGTSIAKQINDNVRIDQSLRVTPTTSNDPNQVYTATFRLKNTSNARINLGFMFAGVRDSNNRNYDFPARTITLEPNATYTYTASRTFPQTGKLNVFIGGKLTQIGWTSSAPAATDSSVVRTRSIIPKSDVVLLNPGISVTKVDGAQYRATATFKNNSSSSKNIGWFLVSARTPSGVNVDFPTQNIIIPAGGTATYSQIRSFDLTELGKFTFFTNLDDPLNGYGWTTTYPGSEQTSTARQTSFLNGPSVIQTQPIQTQTLSDGSIKATVEYTNYGSKSEYMGWVILSTRLNGNPTNYDFQPQEVTLRAGETRTLTFTKRFVKGGDYTITPLFYRWPEWWSSTYAPVQKPAMQRQATFTSSFAAEQLGDITVNRSGNDTTAAITIRNKTNSDLELGDIVISVRDVDGNNLDFPMVWGALKPGETKTFTTNRSLAPGTYRITSTVRHHLHGWGPTYEKTTDKDYSL